MKKAIKDYSPFFATILGLAVIAAVVGGFILVHQRFVLPNWVPVAGSDFVNYKAELPTAQSITPGQGQTVNVAGVPVGEISKVDLYEGKAVVTMKIRRKFTPIYRDATILVRPKTGLNDIVLQLSPGSKSSGKLPENGKTWIPVRQTIANVNLDEILASLDGDTRSYLQLLIGGAGQGLRGQGRTLSADLKRFEPISRDVLKITKKLATRRRNISRTVHNFRLLAEGLAGKDKDLTRLVTSSNQVFSAFAAQDARLRQTLRDLPPTLQATQIGLTKAGKLADVIGPTLQALRPGARALGPALKATRPFLTKTEPVIRTQLRPFARDARPAVRVLRPAARDLATVTPKLTASFRVVNYLLNELAYDKPGDGNESYLFYVAWANHLGNTLFGNADANGVTRRGLIVIGCSGLGTLEQLKKANPQLGVLVGLLNPVQQSSVCAQSSAPGAAPGTSIVPSIPGVTLPSIPGVTPPPLPTVPALPRGTASSAGPSSKGAQK
jgi:phospholipid/cholesterol/gamma-HCH transport system substrate-binding protein